MTHAERMSHVPALGPNIEKVSLMARTVRAPTSKMPTDTQRDAVARNKLGQSLGLRGAERRQTIVCAATELLKAKAPWEISVTDVMRKSGATKGTFYTYFFDVRDVLLAAAQLAAADAPDLTDELSADWRDDRRCENARNIINRVVAYWQEHGAVLSVVELMADRMDMEFSRIRVERVRKIHALWERKFQSAQADRIYSDEFSCRAAAYKITAFVDGIGSRYKLYMFAQFANDELVNTLAEILHRLVLDVSHGAPATQRGAS